MSEVRVVRCRRCGHRVARHAGWTDAGGEYHSPEDSPFLRSLRQTRARQARFIIEALRRHTNPPSFVVDYGAGRGWFLEACRAAGIGPLAGLDTSELAVQEMQKAGLEAHRLPSGEDAATSVARLSFAPRVLALLDVLEHFPPDEVASRLRDLVSACGETLEGVVVKVPVPGVLYAGSATLQRIGISGPLRQLYQVGTSPPHLNYFSRESVDKLLKAVGLRVVARLEDADFETASLGDRVGVQSRGARLLARAGGAFLAAAAALSHRKDSLVIITRPMRTGSDSSK